MIGTDENRAVLHVEVIFWGGVMYGSYDEMFISLLPRKVENPELKRILRDYFRIRSEKVKVEESITVYKDATERFGD